MNSHKRVVKYTVAGLLAGLVGVSILLGGSAEAQYGARTFQCVGNIGGVQSAAMLQVEPGGSYGGPYVAGQIQNQAAAYAFTGELFGGVEGFISLVDRFTGQRIDRVWIGLSQTGFALRTEDGSRYVFMCHG